MLILKTRSTNPISTIFLIVLFWLINLGLSFREAFMSFSNWTDFPFAKLLLAQISILATSVLINRTLQKNKLVGVGDGLSGFLFIIFIMGLNDVHQYYRELISLFLITLGNYRLIGLYNVKKNYLKEFEIGILFGLSIVIAPSLFMILGVIYIGITLVVPFTWKDFIVPLLGCLWILFAKFSCLFLFLDILDFNMFSDYSFSIPELNGSIDFTGGISFFLLTLFELIIFFKIFSVLEKRSIKERVFYWLWVWTLIFLFFSLLFFREPFNKFLLITLLGLPCSVFSIEYFAKKGKRRVYWKKEILIYLLLLLQLTLRIY